MFCSNCGKEVSNSQNYCEYCGTKVMKNNINKDTSIKLDELEINNVIETKAKNNTSSKEIQKKVIRISFTKFILLVVLFVLFFIILISISTLSRNSKTVSQNNSINMEIPSFKNNINISGITQEERQELTSILKNFNSSRYNCKLTDKIGKYYQDFGMFYTISESRTNINEKGYIDELYYSLIDKKNNENKSIEVNLTYTFDNKGRPIKIRFDDTKSTVIEYNAFSKNALYEISYLDNGMIETINCTLYKDNTRVEYHFSYKENNDYDKVKVLFYGKDYVKDANHLISFDYLDNKILMSKGEGIKFYFQKDDMISQNSLSEYFNTLLFQSFIEIDETTIINQNRIPLLEIFFPFTIKKSLYCKYISEFYYSYNEDGLEDMSYNSDYTIKSKYDYIKADNKLMKIETNYKDNNVTKSYTIFTYNEHNQIESIYEVNNIEDFKKSANTKKYLMQIWGKDSKFLSREFYTFCSNYRRSY